MMMMMIIIVIIIVIIIIIIISGSAAQRGIWPSRSRGFRDNTKRHAAVGRSPLDE
jgi:FtsZ-interacting cell division protein ZipA